MDLTGDGRTTTTPFSLGVDSSKESWSTEEGIHDLSLRLLSFLFNDLKNGFSKSFIAADERRDGGRIGRYAGTGGVAGSLSGSWMGRNGHGQELSRIVSEKGLLSRQVLKD
jgi:hypothetical protein